jgi:hypothetical protein
LPDTDLAIDLPELSPGWYDVTVETPPTCGEPARLTLPRAVEIVARPWVVRQAPRSAPAGSAADVHLVLGNPQPVLGAEVRPETGGWQPVAWTQSGDEVVLSLPAPADPLSSSRARFWTAVGTHEVIVGRRGAFDVTGFASCDPAAPSGTPTVVAAGRETDLLGTGLASVSHVLFDGVPGTIVGGRSDTRVPVRPPPGAPLGVPLTLTARAAFDPAPGAPAPPPLVQSLEDAVVLWPEPIIALVEPLSVSVGGRVRVEGEGLVEADGSELEVRVDSVRATVVSASATVLEIEVPAGAGAGPTLVQVDGCVGHASGHLTVE